MKSRYVAFFLILVIPALITKSKAQEVTKSKPVFGVRLLTNFNSFDVNPRLNVMVLMPEAFIEFNEHLDMHIGIIYAHIFNPAWYSQTYYRPNTVGLAFGNRITSDELIKNIKIYNEWNISVTRESYKTTNSHFQESEMQSEALWVFNFSLGADYKLREKLHISTGVGVGITNERYGIFSEILLSPFLSFDYRIGCNKKK
jgi:hypothetical protein